MRRLSRTLKTATFDAIRFLIARDDELGNTFKCFFRHNISPKYVDSLYCFPYTFSNYNVLNRLKFDCEMVFGSESWVVLLRDEETEKELLSVLNLEKDASEMEYMEDVNSAFEEVTERIYKFSLLYEKYKECDDAEKRACILRMC